MSQEPEGNQAQTQQGSEAAQPRTTLRTTVRRVVLDVVVTGPKGSPATGLTKDEFSITEDGKPQKILSFEANGFTPAMDYLPPALPPQPPGTYINLPPTPEKGPLYILLYDLTNMDSADQMDTPEDHHVQLFARQQMMKFIQSKPEGARFAIFARSDGLHLIQGFTSDKALLYRALDPHHPRPHMPMVFLLGSNYGRGDRLSAVNTLHAMATYLDGLPGRKNLIWFSSAFPVSLFADDIDGRNFKEETRETLDLLAHDQIAVYPVDARGVPPHDSHDQLTTSVHSDSTSSSIETSSGSGPGAAGGGGSSPGGSSSFVQGASAVVSSYDVMDGIARETGGRAFYSNSDLAGELTAATEDGGVYYTLTYAPSDTAYDGQLRHIHVDLAKAGYQLSYRRSYYGAESPALSGPMLADATGAQITAATPEVRPEGDALAANMEHGGPIAHQLVFVVQAHSVGAPAEGTPEEMEELATEPAYFTSRRKAKAAKPLPPLPLQKDRFSFEIPIRQFGGESPVVLEIAVAAFDAEGRMMNAVVRDANKEIGQETQTKESKRFYRVDEELEVPMGATTVRFAVRDTTNNRIGAMEIDLPLVPESETAPPRSGR